MLYFYGCEIKLPEGERLKADGCLERNVEIKTVGELVEVQEGIRRNIYSRLHQENPDLDLRYASITFLAFNPL